jgi:hypothetical protein
VNTSRSCGLDVMSRNIDHDDVRRVSTVQSLIPSYRYYSIRLTYRTRVMRTSASPQPEVIYGIKMKRVTHRV